MGPRLCLLLVAPVLLAACATETVDDETDGQASASSRLAPEAAGIADAEYTADGCRLSVGLIWQKSSTRYGITYDLKCGRIWTTLHTVESASFTRISDRDRGCSIKLDLEPTRAFVATCEDPAGRWYTRQAPRAAPAPAARTCKPVACETIAKATCSAIAGCAAETDVCSGKPFTCELVPREYCFDAGCVPNFTGTGPRCLGIPTKCPRSNGVMCSSIPGCTPKDLCTGTNQVDCARLGEKDCATTPGCAFE